MNVSLKLKKKRTKFLSIAFLITSVFILFLCISLIGTYYFISQKDIKLNIKSSTNTPPSLVQTSILPSPSLDPDVNETAYFVPVTGFKSIKNNISLSELATTNPLEVMSSELDSIGKDFPSYKLTPIEDSIFLSRVANENNIALISWQKLSPRLKVLSLDNQFFFDKTIDITKYPLQFTQKVTLDKKTLEDFNQSNINRIVSTGEIIPARTVEKFMRNKNDYTYPFQAVKPFLDKYDKQISTLESPLLGSGNGNVCALNCLTFVGNEKFMEGLKYSGVDLVTLADNHSMNAGIEGMTNTIKILDSIGIKHVGGSPTNNEDSTDPAIIEINVIKYGVLGYNDIPSVNDWATDSHGGTGRIDDNNYHILPNQVSHDVARAKAKGAQFIIAMMHWGAREYTNDPLPHQKDLAHNLVDNGVDLVIGDHPHWVMSTEFYTPASGGDPKFIYYGIGNFIFDQDWSLETSQGSFLEMNFYNNKLLSLHIYPHQIYNTQPKLLDQNSIGYKQVMDRIWQYTTKV